MSSAFEQLEQWIQAPEYKLLDEAVQRDFVMASDGLIASYQSGEQWFTLDGEVTINNAPWQVRMGKFVTGAFINEIPVKLAFASLIPRAALKPGLAADTSSNEYQEAIEEYSATVFSFDFAQIRLHIGSLFQQLYPDNKYFFFPMNQSYGLLQPYDYDLVLPYFDVLSFKESLNANI